MGFYTRNRRLTRHNLNAGYISVPSEITSITKDPYVEKQIRAKIRENKRKNPPEIPLEIYEIGKLPEYQLKEEFKETIKEVEETIKDPEETIEEVKKNIKGKGKNKMNLSKFIN